MQIKGKRAFPGKALQMDNVLLDSLDYEGSFKSIHEKKKLF